MICLNTDRFKKERQKYRKPCDLEEKIILPENVLVENINCWPRS